MATSSVYSNACTSWNRTFTSTPVASFGRSAMTSAML